MRRVLTTLDTDSVIVRELCTDPNESANKLYVDGAIDQSMAGGSITEASNSNIGCLNVNPFFGLGVGDYDAYAVYSDDGSPNRSITPLSANNTELGLQVRNTGGTVIGTKKVQAVTDYDLRGTIIYRFRVYGSQVDPAKVYKFRMYLGTKCYDVEDNFVSYADTYIASSDLRTTLAQPANNGDTSIVINTPATPWYSDGTDIKNHQKSLRIFRPDQFGNQVYTGPNSGIVYTPWGYSDDTCYYGYLDYVDNNDGTTTVNLRLPWSLGHFDIGSGVVSTRGGGTYQYWTYGISEAHPDVSDGRWSPWFTMQGSWQTLVGTELNHGTKFRLGTAYARFLLLPNYRLYEDNVIMTPTTGDLEYEVQYSRLSLEWKHSA